ncbi:MAG: tRNA uridine-5-carboxymethylaminomethyl(34) synthesis enzyme MnmG [Lentisphaeria bacterium]
MFYDVIVVGGGHAGCEAALAASRLGAATLILTLNNDHIAQMSCNPAIGGIAKGQVVREIDALGGEMAQNTDDTSIQFRMLNNSKGAAVLSPRAQCDKEFYQRRMKLVMELQKNLCIHQAEATRIIVEEGKVCGIETAFGDRFYCKALVLCTGTFLGGTLHFGMHSMPGGRAGDSAALSLSESLRKDLRLEIKRLKTGTPVRVLGKTIDFSDLEFQAPDPGNQKFSFDERNPDLPVFSDLTLKQRPCYMTYSTDKTAEIVKANLTRSTMYSGKIHGTGARYCPSFEDKIVRFINRTKHHIYIEPEGNCTDEYYLNGLSTSMPIDIQWQMVRSLPGLSQAHISRYAYAIEYDFVIPHQLDSSLALKDWPALFLAGQINGTSGYEEAAGQGIIAGINAARHAGNLGSSLVLQRNQAYIGVMIDDLITKDIVEPYRLFTSRAEYRLNLRQDNADLRLTNIGYEYGLAKASAKQRVDQLQQDINEAKKQLCKIRFSGHSAWEWMARPDFHYADEQDRLPVFSPRVLEQLNITARYEGYMVHQEKQAKSLLKLDNIKIPKDFNYDIQGFTYEAKSKLQKSRPENLRQASRIDGVTPAEIAIMQVQLRSPKTQKNLKHE